MKNIDVAGIHCHMAATGIGSFVKRNFPIQTISVHNYKNISKQTYNIAGPLCTPGDLLAQQIELPEIHAGDLIMVEQSGAYGLSASPGRFLSHGFPAEVLFDHGKLFLLRKRETVDDICEKQLPLIDG